MDGECNTQQRWPSKPASPNSGVPNVTRRGRNVPWESGEEESGREWGGERSEEWGGERSEVVEGNGEEKGVR